MRLIYEHPDFGQFHGLGRVRGDHPFCVAPLSEVPVVGSRLLHYPTEAPP